ncbi:Alcohol dehydrogenase zinc-binding domain protein [Halorhabdus utahensis DSM 12940]|uniref:Alcohol dehydrogenase zinc-binding domain protein n=1 Tax=Halorhabdus utahensis (strain DSM 12940 / JCM 11049 / AX-2) TaxID=519442 RepID=C7NTH7_HALUD|nr:zinc-binding alcohol dehydrogenase [Halorhabdus utahensis]ACV12167.1 Alcohol dehydrogenase zinc-binding domain protein [Halorhabdus utahensis DSM 12940]
MTGESLYFTGPEALDLRERSVEVSADEVLVETHVSAISPGTELLIYHGEAPRDLPADETLDALDGDLSYPLRYGYAAVGEVIETGSAVDPSWQGREVFGFNPHETRFSAEPSTLIPVPDGTVAEEMVMYPTVETATTLVLDGGPRVGERVVVFGAGAIGLCVIGLLASFPLSELVVVDPLSARRERARQLGADTTLAPDDLTANRWDDAAGPDGADLVYELSGTPSALDDALAVAGYDSRIVVGSWYGTKSPTLDLGGDFHRDRVSIESSQVSTIDPDRRGRWSFDRRTEVTLDNLASLPVESLVTHRIPFEEAPDAYRLLDDQPEDALQVLLTYH